MATIVWLNGPSRQSLIKTLPQQEIEVGCNYIRQDRKVDHVVCFDHQMMRALKQEEGVKYWTRNYYANIPPFRGLWNSVVSNNIDPQNSGVLAIQLAHNISKGNIYIIGLDWGITKETSYDYSNIRKERRLPKHTNHCIKHLKAFNKMNNIFVVHDSKPDVITPIITKEQFLKNIQ
tara:strand:- start:407 stop:934 length:528 start_codon:yes stop_codon:yes gene_type:complete